MTLQHRTLSSAYQTLLDAGQITPDAAQAQAVVVLDGFLQQLSKRQVEGRGIFTTLLGKKSVGVGPSGLYLYGDVGRGKSMLMDMFFAVALVEKKRRVHFHQFMLEIHARLHVLQAERVDDILPRVAQDIAGDATLLCFDEFHVSNIADAMILGRLFSALFDAGVTVMATSNWPPDELYKNGLQRDRFLPFIAMLKQKMQVYNLNGDVDHRYEQTRDMPTCFSPLGDATTKQLQGIFLQLTHEAPVEAINLPVQGRTLNITHASHGVGFFNFDELCGRPLGAADYLALAECLHTVIIDSVPAFKSEQRNETLRFITLIDALYEAKVKLYMASEKAPDKLCLSGDHAFAFQRTLSRIMEMQGEEYRRKPHLS